MKTCRKMFYVMVLLIFTSLVPNLHAQTTIFYEDFSDNSAGWTLGTEWAIGPATSSSGHTIGNPDPSMDHTATSDNGIAGVVIGGNAGTFVHPFWYLTSPIIDTSNYSDLSFSYYRWLNSDNFTYMDNIIQVYDGTSWQKIWNGSPTDNAWIEESFDISAYANNDLQIRFGHTVKSNSVYTMSSWNIDDVSISGTPVVPEPISSTLFIVGGATLGFRQFRKRKSI